MKNIILILLVSILNMSCKAQDIFLKENKDTQLNLFIGNMISYQKTELKNSIITCIIISSPSGSANNSETDEVSNKLYISICQFGELTDCKLYVTDNLIKINVENIIENDSEVNIKITSGNFRNRITNQVRISK